MAVWVVRAGRRGAQEEAALKGNFVTIGWNELRDITPVQDKEALRKLYRETYPNENTNQVDSGVGQVWTFCKEIECGHLVVLPLYGKSKVAKAVAIGRVAGPYCYRADMGKEIQHVLHVEWRHTNIPLDTETFCEDLFRALRCPPTVYQIGVNNAEQRIQAVVSGEKDPGPGGNGGREGQERCEERLRPTPTLSGRGRQGTSPHSNLEELLDKYVKDVKEWYESCQDEAATKASLIVPLFTILGYNVANPRECQPEHKADFGAGRTKDAVDWAFLFNGSPAFLVEAKAVGEKLDKHVGQLREYYGQGQPAVTLGILTNGVQWRFFTDVNCEHVMDAEPFLEWQTLEDGGIPHGLLTILQRENFKADKIKRFAKRKRRASQLAAGLPKLLAPSDEFVKLAVHDLGESNLGPEGLQEWKLALADAIREWAEQQRKLTLEATDAQDKNQSVPPPIDPPSSAVPRVRLRDLIDAGFLKAPLKLRKCYLGTDLEADLQPGGAISFQGNEYAAPSSAATDAASQVTGEERAIDGWAFWQYQEVSGNWVPLDVARQQYLARKAT